MMSYRASEILIRSLLIVGLLRGTQSELVVSLHNRSASSTSQRHGPHTKGGFDFGHDDFRWHSHASTHVRTRMNTFAVGNRGSDFFCQPTSHVEFRHKDVLRVLRSFANFFFRPWSQSLNLDQPAADAIILQQADR